MTLTGNVLAIHTDPQFSSEQVESMKSYKKYLLGAFSLSLISAAAMADPGHGPQGKFMMFFDTNHDNMVTISELNAAVKQRFETMDADGNGMVTPEEFKAYISERRAERQQQRFAKLDANDDGTISKDEFVQYQQKLAEQRFQRLDTNNDGAISKDEFDARQHGFRDGKYGHHGKYGMRRHGGGERFFARMDSNHDGQLTLDENLAAWTTWFNRIDANHDQVVTVDEVNAFRDTMKQER